MSAAFPEGNVTRVQASRHATVLLVSASIDGRLFAQEWTTETGFFDPDELAAFEAISTALFIRIAGARS